MRWHARWYQLVRDNRPQTVARVKSFNGVHRAFDALELHWVLGTNINSVDNTKDGALGGLSLTDRTVPINATLRLQSLDARCCVRSGPSGWIYLSDS